MSNSITVEHPSFRQWFSDCQLMCDKYNAKQFPNLVKNNEIPDLIISNRGRKYIKIILSNSVWAFINKENGDILKPASWKAPAKIARGNIFDEYKGMKSMSPYGPAYL